MIPDLLGELAGDVARLLTAGGEAAPRDRNLKKRVTALREAAAKVPALAPLADAAGKLLRAAPADAPRSLLSLLVRAQRARLSLAGSSAPGTVAPLPGSGPWESRLPAADVYPIASALPRSGSGREKALAELTKRPGWADLRLLEPFLAALADPYPAFADEVAEALPAFGPGLAAELRLRIEPHGDKADARRLRALSRSDKGIGREVCRAVLKDGSNALREQALKSLGEIDPKAASEAALGLLEDANKGIRTQAFTILAENATPENLDVVLHALTQPDDVWAAVEKRFFPKKQAAFTKRLLAALRRELAEWDKLAARKPPKDTAKLSKYASHFGARYGPKVLAICRLVGVLGHRGGHAGVIPKLLELARHPSADVRFAAVKALGETRQAEKTVPAIIAAMNDPSEVVVSAAVWAVPFNVENYPELFAALRGVIEDAGRKEGIRSDATWMFGIRAPHSPENAAFLAALLKDPSPRVRRQATEALGRFGDAADTALPELLAACSRETDYMAGDALHGVLRKLDPDGKGTIAVLREQLEGRADQPYHVVCGALHALEAYGPKAASAEAIVAKLAAEPPDHYQGQLAAEALAAIRGASPAK